MSDINLREVAGPSTYYKAVRPDGTDFWSGKVQWIPADGIPEGGHEVHHPTSTKWLLGHGTHLCASTSPTDCTGFKWPCRLLEVQPVAEVHQHGGTKRSALAWRVVRELTATDALGPQGVQVAALIEHLPALTASQKGDLGAARGAARGAAWGAVWGAARGTAWDAARGTARGAAWDAARGTARGAAWDAARGTAWGAAWDAVVALLMRDLISAEHYDVLVRPWESVMGTQWTREGSDR